MRFDFRFTRRPLFGPKEGGWGCYPQPLYFIQFKSNGDGELDTHGLIVLIASWRELGKSDEERLSAAAATATGVAASAAD